MPIYEYRCLKCGKAFSFLVGVVADCGEPACPSCGGKRLAKMISRIARIRSRDALMEDLTDPTQIGDMDDPKAMARWAKKMGRTLGEEAGEDFGEELDSMLENPEGREGEPDEE